MAEIYNLGDDEVETFAPYPNLFAQIEGCLYPRIMNRLQRFSN